MEAKPVYKKIPVDSAPAGVDRVGMHRKTQLMPFSGALAHEQLRGLVDQALVN